MGFGADESTVTVIGAEAPHSVIYSGNSDDPENHERLLRQLAAGLANVATNNAVLRGGAATVVLNPEHADMLVAANLSREGIQQRLYELASFDGDELSALSDGGFGGAAKERMYCFPDPDHILVLTAGGSGLYSMVMPSWCAGAHRNSAITVAIEMDQACEVPGAAPMVDADE